MSRVRHQCKERLRKGGMKMSCKIGVLGVDYRRSFVRLRSIGKVLPPLGAST